MLLERARTATKMVPGSFPRARRLASHSIVSFLITPPFFIDRCQYRLGPSANWTAAVKKGSAWRASQGPACFLGNALSVRMERYEKHWPSDEKSGSPKCAIPWATNRYRNIVATVRPKRRIVRLQKLQLINADIDNAMSNPTNSYLEQVIRNGILIDMKFGSVHAWAYMLKNGIDEALILRVLSSADRRADDTGSLLALNECSIGASCRSTTSSPPCPEDAPRSRQRLITAGNDLPGGTPWSA